MSIHRSSSQKLESLSRAKLKQIISCWIVNDLTNDFGFDFEVRLTDEESEKRQTISPESFYIQLKASHSFNSHAYLDIEVKHLKVFFQQRIPVLLIKYYEDIDKFFWEIIQNYVLDFLDKEEINWKNQQSKRIVLKNELNDISFLECEIIKSQIRITKYQAFLIPIGEGINFNSYNMDELRNIRNRSLEEFKKLGILESDALERIGLKKESQKILLEVINAPRDDVSKIYAIIRLIWSLNIGIDVENKKIVNFALYGIKIANKLKYDYLSHYLTIFKNQALLHKLNAKNFHTFLSKRISEKSVGDKYSIFFNMEIIELNKLTYPLIKETNDSLIKLQDKNFYFFMISLPLILDIISNQIYFLATIDKDIIKNETNIRGNLLEICEKLVTNSEDTNFRKIMYKSLSIYFYRTLNQKKAINYLKKAIENGKQDEDPAFVEWNLKILSNMEKNPSPYEIPPPPKFQDVTAKEVQVTVKHFLEAGGYLNPENEFFEAIQIALKDLDLTEMLKFCINIFVEYVSPSELGRILALPSLGHKVIWCKHGGLIGGFNLKSMFDGFFKQYCESCSIRESRAPDWGYTMGWIENHNKNKEFNAAIKKYLSIYYKD